VTTILRVISSHCSIQAHLERLKIVAGPICVCMTNYKTFDHMICECSRKTSTPVGTRDSEYKRKNTNPRFLRVLEMGSIEIMPLVPKGIWPEYQRNGPNSFYLFSRF
jgi:hypothetical protein